MRDSSAPTTSNWPTTTDGSRTDHSSPFDRIIPWQRWEWWVLVGLFIITFATRWPMRVSALEEVDSANYALAMREFNLAAHQPQPPGYLFFIGAASFAHLWIPDPIEALTAVQVMSGALAIVLFYALLRLCMPPAWALASTLLLIFNAQVWFQHVRPMEDAYAFLWMLVAIYALLRSLSGDARWWISGMVVLGLGMGAKQLLPGFIVGLWILTFWEYVRHGRFHIIALGILGSGIASLTWFIPLSLHMGTAQAYVAAASSQLAWGREHDALLFNWSPSRLASQWRTTMVLIWGPQGLALPMWALVLLGASQVVVYHAALRWLLWLVLPILFFRFLFLGYWPRFTLYYLPFLIPLAVVGFYTLVHASLSVIHRIGSSLSRPVHGGVLRPSLWFMMPGVTLLAGWVILQVHYIGPTLRMLHHESSPVVEAMQWIHQHYNPTTIVLLSDNDLITRHLDYYAGGTGIFIINELHGDRRPLESLQSAHHVLKMQAWPVPLGFGHHLRTWSLNVPRWPDLSLRGDFHHVSLYEFQGPFAFFSEWQGAELDATRVVRWSKPEGSQIWIFRVPPHGCAIRLQGVIPVRREWASPPPVTVRINGEPVDIGEQHDQIDVSLYVHPMKVVGGKAVIDVQPGCAFIPTQIERSSSDPRHLGCFLLTGLTIQP
jgi:hypothetical protein